MKSSVENHHTNGLLGQHVVLSDILCERLELHQRAIFQRLDSMQAHQSKEIQDFIGGRRGHSKLSRRRTDGPPASESVPMHNANVREGTASTVSKFSEDASSSVSNNCKPSKRLLADSTASSNGRVSFASNYDVETERLDEFLRQTKQMTQQKSRFTVSRAQSNKQRPWDSDNELMERALSRASAKRNSEPAEADVKELTVIEHTRAWVRRLVKSHAFEFAVFIAISTNAMLVGVQVQYSADHPNTEPLFFLIVDCLYTFVFTVEIAARMFAAGRGFFNREDLTWNCFDIFIVATSLVDTFMSLATTLSSTDWSQMRILRALKVIRLFRTLRLIRLIRFIRALRQLVHSMFETMKSLVWAMLLMFMTCYSFGVAFTQATTEYFSFTSDSHERLLLFWSSVPRSMYSLFKAITGGISWHEVVTPLASISWIWVGLFIVFVTFTFFAVLNVITGVFCQSAIDSAQQDKDLITMHLMANKKTLREGVTRLFGEIDTDKSGSITLNEFEDYLANEKSAAYFEALEIDPSDAWLLFKLLDRDEGGSVEINEFIDGCIHFKGPAKAMQLANIERENLKLKQQLAAFMDSMEEEIGALLAWAGFEMPSSEESLSRGASEYVMETCSFTPARYVEAGATRTSARGSHEDVRKSARIVGEHLDDSKSV